ncbi:MAG: hypothetical protein QF447_07235 [Candidatus Thioglobus sp.]|nr:hypothetical protein [Candidatus Thioglobus sp.]
MGTCAVDAWPSTPAATNSASTAYENEVKRANGFRIMQADSFCGSGGAQHVQNIYCNTVYVGANNPQGQ